MQQEVAGLVRLTAARRLVRLNVVAATAFFLGGSLFALGAAFAQLDIGSLTTVNVTYLAGASSSASAATRRSSSSAVSSTGSGGEVR